MTKNWETQQVVAWLIGTMGMEGPMTAREVENFVVRDHLAPQGLYDSFDKYPRSDFEDVDWEDIAHSISGTKPMNWITSQVLAFLDADKDFGMTCTGEDAAFIRDLVSRHHGAPEELYASVEQHPGVSWNDVDWNAIEKHMNFQD